MSVTTVATIHGHGLLAARPAATAVPVGTYFFATDTGLTYRSNGTTWDTQTPASGAPTAHAASHHSGGGDVLALASIAGTLIEAQTPLTTKGDLLVSDGTTLQRAPVGANGHVLTADSAEALGLKWAAAAGGGSGPVFKQTLLRGNGNKTTTSTTFVAIDSTNLAYLTLAGLSVGDVVELELVAQTYSDSSNYGFFDFEVDRPTSANHRANEDCEAGAVISKLGTERHSLVVRSNYVVGEAGTHGFRPVWRVTGGTQTLTNATSGNDDTLIQFVVTDIGPVTA